jgi:hypothetical protein
VKPPRHKAALVRYYLDADVLGLARLLVQIRTDVTFPGDSGGVLHKRHRPACPITRTNVLDIDWLPVVSGRGWLIITRDWHISDHRQEIKAVREFGARMITLASSDARTVFDQLEVVMCRWRDIEGCLDQPGPFIYKASRTAFTPLDLEAA